MLVWAITSTVIGGYLGKQVLSWFNQSKYAPAVDITVAIGVFLEISGYIVKGILAASKVLNSIPK